jgi:hypothetical protein
VVVPAVLLTISWIGWLDANDYVAIATVLIALFTVVLALVACQQVRLTRTIERAYVNAEQSGIKDMTTGELVGHVTFRNVGRLPAREFRWAIGPVVVNGDSNWKPPRVADGDLSPTTILPLGGKMRMGSPAFWQKLIDECQSEVKYVFIWGRATYVDGFGKKRYVDFCHRYNWATKYTPPGGGIRLDPEEAPYHKHGNDAD